MLPARGRRGAGSSRGDGGLSVSGAAAGRAASAARAPSARKAGFLRYAPRRARAREPRPPPAPRRAANHPGHRLRRGNRPEARERRPPHDRAHQPRSHGGAIPRGDSAHVVTGPTSASRPAAPSAAGWWRRAVVYQVYIRSFADANGDGIGDIAGIRSRLPYLHDLRIDALWITPWYPSPMADGGYDVADYRSCLLYTSDAADDLLCVDLGGRRII